MTRNDSPSSPTAEQPSSTLPVEEVARYPLPGFTAPVNVAFSPDDRLITYLFSPERTLSRQLYALDPETGEEKLVTVPSQGGTTEENVSAEEALRRERQRQLGLGVTRYSWAKHNDRLLIPIRGDLYLKDGVTAQLRQLLASQGRPILGAQISPDGNWVAYVQDAELYVIAVDEDQPRQLTHGARGTGKTHGLAEFIAQEEMKRSKGFWWSPDSQWIAFTEVDETHIPVYRIVHQGQDRTGEAAQEDHHYPFAGRENARVRLGVISVRGGEPVWMDLGDEEDMYLARVRWLPDGGLTAQVENREQTELELLRLDPHTGRRSTLLREETDVWINLHHMFKPLEDSNHGYGGGFIWASERTGFQHLYLYDRSGDLIRPLTEGEWMVDSIAGVDEERERVYFMGTRDGATESHLYAVSFSGGKPRRLTREPGMHSVVLDHGFQRFVDVHHALEKPPSVTLRSVTDSSVLQTIYENTDPRVETLRLEPPELVAVQSRDGVILHAALYRPSASYGSGPYPTIIWVYGGPHAQLVTNGWGLTAAMRAQYLRSLGYLVFVLDNRGSARRGLAFERAIRHKMGSVEVQDQVDGVRWLVEQGLANPEHVGIYGWSYGGYMALMCLAREPETFRVAVAGAPVTHYDGYDTHYTERYMGTPQSNPQGYAEGSAMHQVENISGRLLLVHGLIDENVHFRHTARLIKALIRARKPYDLLLFPDARHSPRSLEDRIYLEERIAGYFRQHL